MREDNQYQNTGAWFADRTGKLTASRINAAMAYLKGKKDEEPKEAAARYNLKREILAERLTGDIVPKYVTKEMQWGVDNEPAAKEAFVQRTGIQVHDVGFIDHPIIENCGCSPDGFTSDGALIEIKCPNTGTHLSWILDGVVPEEHKGQMTLQCAVTGRPYVWFVSYDPRIKEIAPKKVLFIRKFEPTAEEIEKVESMATKFLSEIDTMFEQIINSED